MASWSPSSFFFWEGETDFLLISQNRNYAITWKSFSPHWPTVPSWLTVKQINDPIPVIKRDRQSNHLFCFWAGLSCLNNIAEWQHRDWITVLPIYDKHNSIRFLREILIIFFCKQQIICAGRCCCTTRLRKQLLSYRDKVLQCKASWWRKAVFEFYMHFFLRRNVLFLSLLHFLLN